jgi:hypothetical protein
MQKRHLPDGSGAIRSHEFAVKMGIAAALDLNAGAGIGEDVLPWLMSSTPTTR